MPNAQKNRRLVGRRILELMTHFSQANFMLNKRIREAGFPDGAELARRSLGSLRITSGLSGERSMLRILTLVRNAGLIVDELLVGKLMRCPTVDDRPGQRSGYYRVFDDGGAVYGDWRTGQRHVYQPHGRTLDATSRAMIETVRRERAAEQQAAWNVNRTRLERLWGRASPCKPGGAVERYLAGRGLLLPPGGVIRWERLGYFADGKTKLGEYPAMLLRVQAPDGAVVSIHRTYLDSKGHGKAKVPVPKKLMGACGHMNGVAIRLMEHGERLGIAEGIETALSAAKLFGVPCWAAVSAHGLEAWQPPGGVTTVDVFGDHDANGRGQEAADKLARRLSAAGLVVRVHTPPVPGDWNDVLQGAA